MTGLTPLCSCCRRAYRGRVCTSQMEESDEEILTTEMSEAAKCRVRNRAMRKAREAAAMKEVMEEEYGQPWSGVSPVTVLGVAIAVSAVWWWIGS